MNFEKLNFRTKLLLIIIFIYILIFVLAGLKKLKNLNEKINDNLINNNYICILKN